MIARPYSDRPSKWIILAVATFFAAVAIALTLTISEIRKPEQAKRTSEPEEDAVGEKELATAATRELLDASLASNRTRAAIRELQFWQKVSEIDPKLLSDLQNEADELERISNRKHSEFDRKWGRDSKLAKLDMETAAAYQAFLLECDTNINLTLSANSKAMLLEDDALQAQIKIDVQVRPVVTPKFDLSTLEGLRKAEEFERLKPSMEAVEKAKCDLERTKRSVEVLPKLIKKYVAKTRQENRQMIAELERPFLATGPASTTPP
jgi:hypothetical protein